MSAASISADAPIIFRARRDLIVRPQTYRGQRYWCVKDPVSLAYFHLRDEEYQVLRSLERWTTLGEIVSKFRRRFPDLTLSRDDLTGFLIGLYRNGLVTAELPGQGEKLWARCESSKQRAWLRSIPGVLAIRFRGIDPTWILRTLYDALWWIFTPAVAVIVGLLMVTAITFATIRVDELFASIPTVDAFFTAEGVALFFLALGSVKVLHELGHGLTCVRFGGECHEMGIMLLVFAPCLYCDVSDSWLFPQKWRRISVAAAGIIVELTLAAIATLCWWFSEPGLFHAFCLNVMLICSVNTLLFNGNPLLRYDGYFVLSDLIEIPNLAAEARLAISRLLLGREAGDPSWTSREATLVVYAVVSTAYRVFVTTAIAWFLLKTLTPIGLAPLAWALASICALGLLVSPAMTAIAIATAPRPRKRRGLTILATLAIGAFTVAIVPLPHSVELPAVLRPEGAARVYIPVGGTLVDAVSIGETVAMGELIAQLDDPALEREVIELEARVAELVAQRHALESRRFADATIAAQLPATIEAIEAAASRLESRRRDLADLQIKAPRRGTLLPPPIKPFLETQDELPTWSNTPLDIQNRGCFLEAGTLLCLIGDPSRIEAALFVEEGEVGFLKPGQRSELLFSQTNGELLEGRIVEVATDPLRIAPAELVTGRALAVEQANDGTSRPLQTIYEVRVRLSDADASRLRIRGTGRAKVFVGTEPLVERVYRFLRRTFRFEL